MGVFKIGHKWYFDIYVDGHRVRKVAGDKKSEAIAAMEAIKTDARRGEFKFTPQSKIKFKDFAKEYIEYSKANKKSWKRDEASLKNLKPFFKDYRLSKITPRLIEEYKKERMGDVSPATVNRELALMKFMFSLAIKWKICDSNPVKQVQMFQERKFEMKILDRKQINRLIAAAADHLKPIIIVALNTGMRRGEILNLRWKNIDFDLNFIFVGETKSGQWRKIPMNGVVAATLKKIKHESEFVFCHPKRKGQMKDIKKSFRKAREEAKLFDLRFHDLRHSAATLMVQGGADLATISQILGHSDIRTTMKYAHPTPENKRKAVGILAAIFDEKLEKIDKIWPKGESEKAVKPLQSNN
jgi:integrase